jgi:hypothetical protein
MFVYFVCFNKFPEIVTPQDCAYYERRKCASEKKVTLLRGLAVSVRAITWPRLNLEHGEGLGGGRGANGLVITRAVLRAAAAADPLQPSTRSLRRGCSTTELFIAHESFAFPPPPEEGAGAEAVLYSLSFLTFHLYPAASPLNFNDL